MEGKRLTSSPNGISASFISLMQMKWLTFCQNNNSYIYCVWSPIWDGN